MTDWEKRARELFSWNGPGLCPLLSSHPARERALQLGREMADERAEEIAKKIEASWMNEKNESLPFESGLRCAIHTARSFISKKTPKIEDFEDAWARHPGAYNIIRVGSRLYRHPDEECLPAEADTFVQRHYCAANLLPEKYWSLPRWESSKPRTREAVLEEALRAIEAACPPGFPGTDPRDWSLTRDGGERAASVARRALEWRPEGEK